MVYWDIGNSVLIFIKASRKRACCFQILNDETFLKKRREHLAIDYIHFFPTPRLPPRRNSYKSLWHCANGTGGSFVCRASVSVRSGRVSMRRRQSFATILVGKSILLREGLARILRSANFRILASVSSADDLLPSKFPTQQPLLLIVHTSGDFDAALEQIELFKERHPDGRVVIVADHYRLASSFRHFGQAPTDISSTS